MANETVLVISGAGIPPYAARGLTQTLEPVAASVVPRRTVNGTLVNLAPSQFRKYRSIISCRDTLPPAVDGVWPGATITVDCVSELSYLTSGGSPGRTVVPGSSRTEGDHTFYRPRLTMMVVAPWQAVTNEYGALVEWQLPLEEV